MEVSEEKQEEENWMERKKKLKLKKNIKKEVYNWKEIKGKKKKYGMIIFIVFILYLFIF
jgi:hypothetical protein